MSKVAPIDLSQLGFRTNLVQPQFADWTGFKIKAWYDTDDPEMSTLIVVRRFDNFDRWLVEWVEKPNLPHKPMIFTHEMLVQDLLHYFHHAALYLYQEKMTLEGKPIEITPPSYFLIP